jgi:hypothetical protein
VRFFVQRVSLIKLLKAFCSGAVPLLRMEASAGFVTLSYGDIEAGCEATVEWTGVCFLRHSKLKNLIQTYHSDAGHSATIDIEVRPSGIRVGRTRVSRAGWEISLFAKPENAPRTLRFREPFVPEEPPQVDLQMHLPLFPAGVDDAPLHSTPRQTPFS